MSVADGLLMPHRLLVVDDEAPILFAMREYFGARGYQVACARNLFEAGPLLEQGHLSAVIADLRLTGSHRAEGLEIVEWVRTHYPRTRLVVLTAYGSPEVEREARRRGVDAFLYKPTPLSQVERIVSDLVGLPDSSFAPPAGGGDSDAIPGSG
jgi:DNA-binding NtrC family response regulator